MGNRIKAMRRQLDEAEEEISREKAHRRKAQREADDYVETNESMSREINNLKNKLKRGMGGLPSSRLLKGRGSVAPGDDSLADTDSVDEHFDKCYAGATPNINFNFITELFQFPPSTNACYKSLNGQNRGIVIIRNHVKLL